MTTQDKVISVAAIIAFVAAITGYVKALVGWLRGFLIISVWIDDNALRAITSYLNAQGRRVGGGPRTYAAETRYMRGQGHSEIVPFEELDRASSMFWIRRRPVWVTKAEKPLSEHHLSFRLSVVRGLLNPERIIVDACAWASEDLRHVRQRHRVIHHHGRSLTMDSERGRALEASPGRNLSKRGSATRLIGHVVGDIEPPPAAETLDEMIVTPEVRDLTGAIRRWFSDRLWCTSHGIPWRAGFLYEGEPGSGKTSHARCVAVDLDLPVHVFDLATMNNEDLRSSWMQMVSDAPCMALIEDIDRVFDGDKNVAPPGGMLANSGLTFNALLNAIDGIERHDGVLLIVTTNHVDKVDPAIRDRKGRIDQVVHFGPLDHAGRVLLARRIVDDPALAERLACEHSGGQTSAFVAACCDAARRARYEPAVDLGPMRTAP